jgi:hypothetical protein
MATTYGCPARQLCTRGDISTLRGHWRQRPAVLRTHSKATSEDANKIAARHFPRMMAWGIPSRSKGRSADSRSPEPTRRIAVAPFQTCLVVQPDPTTSAESSGGRVFPVTRCERQVIVIPTNPALIDRISPDSRRIEILQDDISTVSTHKIVATGT